MIDIDFAWPSDEMNFWNVSNEEYLVRVSWSKNHFENYKNLSYSYYQCGYKTILEIVQNSDNNLKTDMWFLASIFLLRQSIELGLKAIICRESEKNKKHIQSTFEKCQHDLSLLINEILGTSEQDFLTNDEFSWLTHYLVSLEEIDKKSEVFRFPFNESFLEKYRDAFLDIYGIGNNILQAFCLVKKIIEKGKVNEGEEFDRNLPTDFLFFAKNGIGSCYLWQPISDNGFYVKIEGFCYVADFLYGNHNICNLDKCFPLIFLLRNALELCLKRLLYCKVDIKEPSKKMYSKRKTHDLMELWNVIKPIILQYMDSDDSDYQLLPIVEKQIQFLNSIDRKGFTFRYPTTYSLQYVLNNVAIDIQNVFNYMMSLINFFDGCDSMLDSIADYQFEIKSYFITD